MCECACVCVCVCACLWVHACLSLHSRTVPWFCVCVCSYSLQKCQWDSQWACKRCREALRKEETIFYFVNISFDVCMLLWSQKSWRMWKWRPQKWRSQRLVRNRSSAWCLTTSTACCSCRLCGTSRSGAWTVSEVKIFKVTPFPLVKIVPVTAWSQILWHSGQEVCSLGMTAKHFP